MDSLAKPAGLPAIARFPVTTIQRQFWFMDQIAPGDPALNIAVRWELRGKLRAASLETAFRGVIDRHEIFRTRFTEHEGQLSQEVVEQVPFRLGVVDLRTTPAEHHADRVDQIALEEAAQPFDLSQPGLLRVTLVQLASDRAIVLITAHHIVFDGYSIGVLGQEVGLLAAAAEAGRPAADLPELLLQYGDYALWQREYLASGVLDEDAAYWTAQLRGAPYFELAADKPRPALRSSAVARAGCDIPTAVVTRMEAAARARGVSLFAFGTAAVSAAFHRITGAAEVLMSTPIAGRFDTDLESLIGPFINTHVLRLPFPGDTGFDAHVAATGRVVEQALSHQSLPFSRLVELLNPPRDPSRAPLASMSFSLQHVFHRDHDFGGFELISQPSHTPGSAQDLNIVLIGRPRGWRLSVEYNPDLFEATTAEALVRTLAEAFEALSAEGPVPAPAELPLDPALAGRAAGAPRPFAKVEAVLSAHPEVAAVAAVSATPDGDGGGAGACYAFVSPRPASLVPLETLPAELMGFAARRLTPDEMPSGVSVLAALPRTASGDLDRARLPRPVLAPVLAPAIAPVLAPVSAPAQPAQGEDLEAALSTLWSDLLGRAEIPRDVSFFDLGGHSLLAVRLIARIRERWGVRLSVATLYQTPTLAALTARLAQETGPAVAPSQAPAEDDWRIEPLLTEGTGQPIIGVNDVGLIIDTCGHMQDRHPATCVRLFDGTRGIDHSPRSFEEIAWEYANTIRRAQPEGPYLLFGVCVHGNIALEAARILQAEGAEVTGVVIKDVWEPGYAAGLKTQRATRWAERIYALRNKIRMVRMGLLSVSAMLGSYRIIRRTGILQMAHRLGLIERVRASDLAPEQERFVSYISAARNVYRPEPLDLPVLHVVTRITAQGKRFLPSIGWEHVVAPGQLKTVKIDQIFVQGRWRLGTQELAQEIDSWLEARG